MGLEALHRSSLKDWLLTGNAWGLVFQVMVVDFSIQLR